MARGRTTSLTIHLSPAERRTLHAWQRAISLPAGLVRRARIILLLADGMPITAIATTVGMSRPQVYKWIHRFRQEGLARLSASTPLELAKLEAERGFHAELDVYTNGGTGGTKR